MKKLTCLLPITVLIMLLMILPLAGCRNSVTTPAATGTVPEQSDSANLTAEPQPTAAATEVVTETTAAPTTTAPTTVQATAAPTNRVEPAGLDNTKTSWYFNAGTPLGQDKPAFVPTAVKNLISKHAVIWQAPLEGQKVVYLTMDEGYEFKNNTTRILDILKAKSVHATFFITGSYLKYDPDLVLRMADEGHLVANHTVNHRNLPDLLESGGEAGLLSEVKNLETSYQTLTGRPLARFLRPPEGSYSDRLLTCLDNAGYRTVFWSYAYQDWVTDNQPEPTAAKAKILGQIHNGSVMLLHAVSETNVSLLPELIDEIQARGYRFALLSEIPAAGTN